MTLDTCRRRLFVVWLIGAAPTFLVLFTRTLGFWRGDVVAVWGWFATVLGPTLSFVVAAYVAGARDPDRARRRMDGALFYATVAASALYLLLVLGVVVAAGQARPALAFLHAADPGLGVAQGLVSAMLAYFLVR